MNDAWVIVPYDHGPLTGKVELGLGTILAEPTSWTAAYPDVVDGEHVIRAQFPDVFGKVIVWIRDRTGSRKAMSIRR